MGRGKPTEVEAIRAYYAHFNFTFPQVLAMIEFECKSHNRSDRTMIPDGWDIETAQDVYGGCSVSFSKDNGAEPFTDEELERVRVTIEGVERAFWELTKEHGKNDLEHDD